MLSVLAAPMKGLSPESPAAVVSKVMVRLDGKPAGGPFLDLISITPGDAYSRSAVDMAVKQIFKTGLFSDVSVLQNGDENIELTFVLTRHLIVRRVAFHGTGVRTSRLRESLETLRPGNVFFEDRLPKALDELREGLKREGYFDPVIKVSTVKDRKFPRVDITFRITGWKRYRIKSLDFRGPILVQRRTLAGRMKSRPGDIYLPSRLERDIQKLGTYYTSLGYRRSDIVLGAEQLHKDEGTVDLILDVQPREKISIVINGARIPSSLLAPIWEERVFEEWGLAEGEARILGYLRKKGYVFASLRSRIERPENEIRVVYDVIPGRKYRIDKVTFEGLKAFTAPRLRQELVVSERLLFFSLMSYDRLFALPGDIEYFYLTNGFPEVQVNLNFRETLKGIDAVLRVQEGPQQRIQSITLQGAKLISPGDILKHLVSAEKKPYFAPNVQRDIGIIESTYLNHGVRGTKVTSRVDPAGENLFALTYVIDEGRPVTIRNIIVAGNRATRPRVIQREILVRKGGPADFSLIQETKRRLEKLGIFSDVRTDEIRTGPENENLVVTVEEGEGTYAGAGIGFESENDVRSLALWANVFRPRATAELIRNNVLGLAAQLSLVGQYSLIEKRAIVSWNQPYLFGVPLRPSLLGWLEQEDETSFAFDRRGVSFNLIKPIGRNSMLLGTLSWTRTKLTKLEIAESDVDHRFLPYATAMVSLSLIVDRRDDTFNPERGAFFSVVGELASPILGTESKYWKTFFKFQYLKPIYGRLNFSLLTRLGLSNGQISIPERFFAGGSNSFRGEGFDNLGPKDPTTGKPTGGQALLLVNSELRFPLIPTLRDLSGVTFFDVGDVYAKLADFHLRGIEAAAGLGLRYKTPLGPVRLEMAWNLLSPARRGKPLFFVTIGNVF